MTVDFSSTAVAATFAAFGEMITYRPAAGAERAVRAIVRKPDVINAVFDTRVSTSTMLMEIRASDITAPRRGDTIIYQAISYEVQGAPQADLQRLVWSLEVVSA